MKHFNFDLYKESKQYFQLFDVYIKQFEKNKENPDLVPQKIPDPDFVVLSV